MGINRLSWIAGLFLLMPVTQAAVVSVAPQSGVINVNDLFTVDVLGTGFPTTTGNGVQGGGFSMLFDPAILEVVSVSIDGAVWNFVPVTGTLDNVAGSLVDVKVNSFPGVTTGSFTVATVGFLAKSGGTSNLLLSASTNPWGSGGAAIDPAYQPGSITVSAVPLPGGMFLLLSGLLGLSGFRRRNGISVMRLRIRRWSRTVLLTTATMAFAGSAAAVELLPNPNFGTITITTPDVESHGQPYESFGAINVEAGGRLTNFFEFTVLAGNFIVKNGGTLANDGVEGVFVIDEIGSLTNLGSIDNAGRFKNSWTFGNGVGSVFNNNAGATLTNTHTMDQRGLLTNDGAFLNSVDPFSGDGAALQNVGTWTNTGSSSFVNLGVTENFGTIDNAGFLQNRLGASGGITQGKMSNRNTINNLAGGAMSNEHRWFNRSSSVLNNSGTFTNSFRGLGFSNEAGSVINNLNGGVFNNEQSLISVGAISNAGTFLIPSFGAVTGTGTYTQTAGSTEVDGTLGGAVVDIQDGVLTGAGTVVGPLTIGAAATVDPGGPSGVLTVQGDASLAGRLRIELSGTSVFDRLDIFGTASLDAVSALEIQLAGAYVPALGDSFDIVQADVLSGQFGQLTLAALAPGLAWDIAYLFDAVGATDIIRASVVSAVPLPATIWLFGSAGLLLVASFRRK